jgi:anti-sigma B factor antagonist
MTAVTVCATDSGRVAVIRLVGEHDVATYSAVRRAFLDDQCSAAQLVVIDLAGCTFLDSTVLGVFVGAVRRARGRGARVCAVNATGIVERALSLTGLDDVLAGTTQDRVFAEELATAAAPSGERPEDVS